MRNLTVNQAREFIAKEGAGNYRKFEMYDTRRPIKRAWGEHLEEFLRSRGGMTWNPVVAGKELDLYVLYHEVCKHGGVEAVVKGKRWKLVTSALELPASCTNAAFTLRKNYYRWLYAFECHDVHNIGLSKEEVEKLAQGLEPTDNEDHADPAANAGADSGGVVGKPKGSSWAGGGGVHAGDTGKKGEGEALRAQPASSSGHATSAFPHAGMAQLGTGPTSRIQPAQVGAPYPKVLPQQPKRNIAMLPLHPPISGMGGPVVGMPGVWHGGPPGGAPLFDYRMPIQRDAWPHASMEGSSVSQAAPPQNVAPRQVCNKRDGEDLAPEEAKKTKSQAKEARHGGKTSVTAMWGNTQIQNPVFKQRMEDERLAAGLVQAAGNRAVMNYGMSQQGQQPRAVPVIPGVVGPSDGIKFAMTSEERAKMKECRECVRAHGGPDIESLGWVYKVGIDGGTEGIFISPQGYRLRSVGQVLQFWETAGGLIKKPQGVSQQKPGDNARSAEYRREEGAGVGEQRVQHKEEAEKLEKEGGEDSHQKPYLDEEMLSGVKFPLSLSNNELIVETLGEIISDHPMYHEASFIFPVGYRARRTCNAGPGKPQTFFCEIMHCGKQPLFRITPLNSTDGKHRIAANNPDAALSELSLRLAQSWNGAAFFGLAIPEVRALVERLPGAHLCTSYKTFALGVPPPMTGPSELPNFGLRLRRDLGANPMLECSKLVNEIMKHRCAWPFLEPVKHAQSRGLEDYGSRIRRPMDLGTVLNKLKADQYHNPHMCRVDVIQVWRNCLYYSGEKDDATFMAREVGEVFDCLFADRVLAPMLKQSSHTISTPQGIVGQKVLVFDSVEFVWRDGLVTEYDAASQFHKVIVDDGLDPNEHKVTYRGADKKDSEREGKESSFTTKTASRMPDLLPPSMLMRINRREQEQQRRQNMRKLCAAARDTMSTAGMAKTANEHIPAQWDTRWMPVPSVDVVLCSSVELDGRRWNGAWPGTVVATA